MNEFSSGFGLAKALRRILFDNAPEIPLLRTLDVDFLVPNPARFKSGVDVSEILNLLGFDNDFDDSTGLVKYVHPDLEIQFLTPACPGKWQRTVSGVLEPLSSKLYSFLTTTNRFIYFFKKSSGVMLACFKIARKVPSGISPG